MLPPTLPFQAISASLPALPWYAWAAGFSLLGLLLWTLRSTQAGAPVPDSGALPCAFPVEPGVQTNAAEVRDLAIGAPLSSIWGFPVNTIRTRASRDDMRGILLDAWDVSSPAQARETLAWLLDEGHRAGFDRVLHAAGPSPAAALPADQDAVLAEPWGHYHATHQALRSRGFLRSPGDLARGTAAWDWSRAVTVARFALSAALLEEHEAWAIIREAGRRSRALFDSWDEFLRSYVIGRAVWNGMPQLDDPCIAQMIENVTSSPESPWQLVAWS